MSQHAETTNDEPCVGWAARVPSWALSLVFHAGLFTTMGLLLTPEQRGAATEPGRDVGVVLAHVAPSGELQYESAPLDAPTADQTTDAVAQNNPLATAAADRPPLDLSEALPKQRNTIGPGAATGQAAPSATGLTQGAPSGSSKHGNFARTKVYGLVGEGQRFVYVFDRSASMGGEGNSALRSAKGELLASLDSLGPEHSFQIIFYNERPTIFNPQGLQGRLTFATDANKRAAHQFVSGMVADGGTNHYDALMMALRLDADVIFFLTDADQPGLSPPQMQRVRRANQRASINCIMFAVGPAQAGSENFMQVLSHENHGQYLYIDISRQLRP